MKIIIWCRIFASSQIIFCGIVNNTIPIGYSGKFSLYVVNYRRHRRQRNSTACQLAVVTRVGLLIAACKGKRATLRLKSAIIHVLPHIVSHCITYIRSSHFRLSLKGYFISTQIRAAFKGHLGIIGLLSHHYSHLKVGYKIVSFIQRRSVSLPNLQDGLLRDKLISREYRKAIIDILKRERRTPQSGDLALTDIQREILARYPYHPHKWMAILERASKYYHRHWDEFFGTPRPSANGASSTGAIASRAEVTSSQIVNTATTVARESTTSGGVFGWIGNLCRCFPWWLLSSPDASLPK